MQARDNGYHLKTPKPQVFVLRCTPTPEVLSDNVDGRILLSSTEERTRSSSDAAVAFAASGNSKSSESRISFSTSFTVVKEGRTDGVGDQHRFMSHFRFAGHRAALLPCSVSGRSPPSTTRCKCIPPLYP